MRRFSLVHVGFALLILCLLSLSTFASPVAPLMLCKDLFFETQIPRLISEKSQSNDSWTAEAAFATYHRSLRETDPSTFKPFTQLWQARLLAQKFNVVLTKELRQNPAVSLQTYNLVFAELWKVPPIMMDIVINLGGSIEISKDSVISHPKHKEKKGKIVPKWESKQTYDSCTGIACELLSVSAVSVDSRGKVQILNSGSVNVILHEFAHILDHALNIFFGHDPSLGEKFKKIHESSSWPTNYERKYSEEAWAESFAKYFHSQQTRLALDRSMIFFWKDFLNPFELFFKDSPYKDIDGIFQAVMSSQNEALRINLNSGSQLTKSDLDLFEKHSVDEKAIEFVKMASGNRLRFPVLVSVHGKAVYGKLHNVTNKAAEIITANGKEFFHWKDMESIAWPKNLTMPDHAFKLEEDRKKYELQILQVFADRPAEAEEFKKAWGFYSAIVPFGFGWEVYARHGQPMLVVLKSGEVLLGHSTTTTNSKHPTLRLQLNQFKGNGEFHERNMTAADIEGVFVYYRPTNSRSTPEQILSRIPEHGRMLPTNKYEWDELKDLFSHQREDIHLTLSSSTPYLIEYQDSIFGATQNKIADVKVIRAQREGKMRLIQVIVFRDGSGHIDPMDPKIIIHSIYVDDSYN